MRSLDFAVELRAAWIDLGVPDAAVLDMPVELGLELVAPIGADTLDTEWELADHVIDKVDSVRLIMPVVNFEGADAGCVIDGRILVALDRGAVF